ncbi:hypothetical protein CALCODRAFT_494587 [Calocera cornea HHB12733]|uniref:Uncharacterized protein n=1 Tax=Calocera cornea HHB12733 TaxID=1353952 RepID=A0A165GZL5_9BASI|nr:hypothetical protein CALCODRAFT_494587 [Calocera cornea HHB12733]
MLAVARVLCWSALLTRVLGQAEPAKVLDGVNGTVRCLLGFFSYSWYAGVQHPLQEKVSPGRFCLLTDRGTMFCN